MGASQGDLALDAAVGAQVRAARLRRGMSLRELSRRLGVSPATLSQHESGRTRLSVSRLARIAAELDVTVGTLLSPETSRAEAPAAPARPPAPHASAPPPRPREPREEPTAGRDWRRYPPLHLDPVLDAALAAFLDAGYHGASIRDIARRAGLSVPGLYHYHASKQDMLARILDLTMTDLGWRTQAARAQGRDPVERFALLIECLALFHTHRRELAFIGASEMRSLEPGNRRRITAMRVAQQRMVDEEVEAAVTAGRFGTPRPHEASRAVVTMCTALAQWYRRAGPSSPEEIAAQYVEFALDLMRHRAG